MVDSVLIYRAGLVASVAASGSAAFIAWRHRDHRGGLPFAAVLTATLVWSGSSLCKSLAVGTPAAVTAWKLVLSSVGVVVAGFLVFALRYTGRDDLLSRKTLAPIAVEPVLFVTLVWTNQFHGLVAPTVAVTERGLQAVDVTFGPALYAHTAYSYLVMTASTFLVAIYALRSRYLYQRQVAVMVVAALVPVCANVPYTLELVAIDPTSLALTVTGVAFTWAVTREKLFDTAPIATEVVLDEIDTAVVVVDTDGRVVDVNAAGRQLFEHDGEFVGEYARTVLGDFPTAVAAYDRLATERTQATEEVEVAGHYYRVQMSPLTERNGDLVGRVYMLVDLTEQRRRRHELERRNEQLDRFAGVVSHDLRNPLQVASGSVELTQQTGDLAHLERVNESHDRMERLIEDLLTIARESELQTDPVELSAVAQSAWDVVETERAELVLDIDGTVDADRTRLRQLFENLFRNAVEHGSTGNRDASGPDDSVEHGSTGEPSPQSTDGGDRAGNDERLTVRVEALPDRAGFAVNDDGLGFGDADTDRLFQAGYTTAEDGTGFGLSIVAEVATQHGWSVEARDSPAGGARVEIRTSGSGPLQ